MPELDDLAAPSGQSESKQLCYGPVSTLPRVLKVSSGS